MAITPGSGRGGRDATSINLIQTMFNRSFERTPPNKYLPNPNVDSQINDIDLTMSSGSGNPNIDDTIPSREEIEGIEEFGSSRNILLNAREIVRLVPEPSGGDSDPEAKEFNKIYMKDENWIVDLKLAKEADETILGAKWNGTIHYSPSKSDGDISANVISAVASASDSDIVSPSTNGADEVRIRQRLKDISVDSSFPTEQDLKGHRDEYGDHPVRVKFHLTQDYTYIPSDTDGDDLDTKVGDNSGMQSEFLGSNHTNTRIIQNLLSQKPYFQNELEDISKICSNFPIPNVHTSTNISGNTSTSTHDDESRETGSYVQYKNGNVSTVIRQLQDPSSRVNNSSLYSVEIIDYNRDS